MALTYPVDLNERYCVWDKNLSQPYEGRSNIRWPNSAGDPIVGFSDNLQMLLVVRDAQPAYNEATQKLERTGPTADLVAESYTYGWNVVALTQAELDANADNADREAKRSTVGGAVATLRQWADDAEATTVTGGNAVATLQQVVDRLGAFFDRFADLIEAQRIDQG